MSPAGVRPATSTARSLVFPYQTKACPQLRRPGSEIDVVRALGCTLLSSRLCRRFGWIGASPDTSAFALAARLSTSRIGEMQTFQRPRVSISCAEADGILHWSKAASVSPASKHGPNLFGRFATLRPSTVDDKGQVQRDLESIPCASSATRRAPCRSGSSRWGSCQSASCRREPADRRAVGAGCRQRRRQSPRQALHPLQSQFSITAVPHPR